MSKRGMSVNGTFYPNDKKEIEDLIEKFNNSFSLKNDLDIKPRAIIAPHAGYIYSGFTANLAYNLSSKQSFKRVIIIGPSHKVYFEGSSIALYDSFETPLGTLDIDLEYSKILKEKYDFIDFHDEVHKEHSTETQAPFVKNYFPDIKAVELIYGKQEFETLSTLIDELLSDVENFIVISTDLSHFHTLEKANKLDNICINAIIKKDMNLFEKGCEACGKIGVKAMVRSAIKSNLETSFLHYCTSYDKTKDDSRVVGYTSVLIGEKL